MTKTMKNITVTIPARQQQIYPIVIGTDVIKDIATLFDMSTYSKAFVITDEVVKPLFLKAVLTFLSIPSSVVVLAPGEKAKTIETVQTIWREMIAAGCDRKTVVLNLGGGVIGDIGGFAASTYMRGVDFINIPTTLLAQVDESVGGKTGFDFVGFKNLIGTFTQPVGVMIDIKTLKTLPKRQFLSGFVEIIKHGLMVDKTYFEQVTSKSPLAFSPDELRDIIAGSCEIKRKIVASDETESGARQLVNLGHTIGHAIEALSFETDEPLFHGEAVAIGIIAEAKIAESIGMLSSTDVAAIEQVLENAHVPLRVHALNIPAAFEKMKADKKNKKGKIHFTLLQEIGKAVIDKHVPDEVITEALHYIIV